MYEQDWMCTEYDGVTQLQENISLGDAWLLGMATGAASSNRTIQYCADPLPRASAQQRPLLSAPQLCGAITACLVHL